MGSGVDQLAAELAASDAARVEARQAAEAKRAAERGFVANLQLSLGMRVEKRRAGGAWSEGFVTSLEPLRITFDCSQGPAAWGRSAGGAVGLGRQRGGSAAALGGAAGGGGRAASRRSD